MLYIYTEGPLIIRTPQQAFTLLELAIVLALVAMMAGFAVKIAPQRDCYAETRAQQEVIVASLDAYVRANNRYPMPAGRGIGINTATSGVSATSAGSSTIDTIGSDPTAVLIGALPYATLGLNAGYGSDCWGNKFTYLISKQLTDSVSYMSNSASGQITVRNGTLSSSSVVTANAAYAVISHGKKSLGAMSRNNNSGNHGYCVSEYANGSITRVDKENCDLSNKTLYISEFNDGESAVHYFDDLVVYAGRTGYTGCNAAAVTWGTSCTANVGAMQHGDASPITNTAASYTGTATVTCNNGTLQLTNTNCSPTGAYSCNGQTVNWSSCSGTSTLLNNNTSQQVTNTVSGKTGTVTINCVNGVLQQTSPTCGNTATCAAGWGVEYVFTMEGVYADCVNTANNIGYCAAGAGGQEGGTEPNSRNQIGKCVSRIQGAATCSVYARDCGCLSNGTSATQANGAALASRCCSGQVDSSGTCVAVANASCMDECGTTRAHGEQWCAAGSGGGMVLTNRCDNGNISSSGSSGIGCDGGGAPVCP